MKTKIRIIIADDNHNFCLMLQNYLREQEDIDIIGVANNGSEAWELIQHNEPDLIILDEVMPNLDGLSILEKINTQTSKSPKIIMITAFGQEYLTNQAMELGVDYFLLKPFDLDTLNRRIHTLSQDIRPSAPALFSSNPHEGQIKGSEINLISEVTDLMHQIGVPAHVKGYQYVRDAILMVVNDITLLGAITKDIYPCIAKKYNTAPTRVDRGIRHAIELAWERGKSDTLKRIFGYSMDIEHQKPTNSEFIAHLAEKMRFMRNVS